MFTIAAEIDNGLLDWQFGGFLFNQRQIDVKGCPSPWLAVDRDMAIVTFNFRKVNPRLCRGTTKV